MKYTKVKASKSPIGVEFYFYRENDREVIIYSLEPDKFEIECSIEDKHKSITLKNSNIKEAKLLAKDIMKNNLDTSKIGE